MLQNKALIALEAAIMYASFESEEVAVGVQDLLATLDSDMTVAEVTLSAPTYEAAADLHVAIAEAEEDNDEDEEKVSGDDKDDDELDLEDEDDN